MAESYIPKVIEMIVVGILWHSTKQGSLEQPIFNVPFGNSISVVPKHHFW